MQMFRIKSAVLDSIITASKNVYPREFFSMLGGKNKTIEELVIVPAVFGEGFSSFNPDISTTDKGVIGTVHSHPTNANWPSNEDLQAFAKSGQVHIIIAHPYDLNSIRAFDSKGTPIQLKVIE